MATLLALPFPLAVWDASDPFGNWSQWRKDNGLGPHRGDDWKAGGGARIPASGAGRVVLVLWNNALGWIIVVEYDLLPGVYFGYCHLQSRPTRGEGSRFTLWDTLGYVGNTGTASYGNHLHLTASYVLGNPGTVPVINPMQFFNRSGVAGSDGTPITEDDMRIIRHPNGTITAVGETTFQHYRSTTEYLCDALLFGTYLQCNEGTYDYIVANTQIRRAYLLAGIAGGGGSAVDVSAIATRVEAALADDFVRLAEQIENINTELGAPTPDEIVAAFGRRLS